jgi:uncharacterized pyridoxal phosphate-containing UPF0001 family protein
VDSIKLARELGRRFYDHFGPQSTKLNIFLEVNIDGEGTKSGLTEAELADWVTQWKIAVVARESWTEALNVAGLMCIPAPDRADVAAPFKRLRELGERYADVIGPGLSMGMTQDFEAAVAEGATHVRIGTALFGERKRREL